MPGRPRSSRRRRTRARDRHRHQPRSPRGAGGRLALADDVGDPAVAQLQQVLRGESAAAVVVVGDDVDGGRSGRGYPRRPSASGCQALTWSTADADGVPTSTRPSTRGRTAPGRRRARCGRRRAAGAAVSCSTGRRPSRSSTYQGSDRSSMTTPMVRVRRSARLRATGSGRYQLGDGLSTACRFSSAHVGEFCRTSDTSDFETPARAATVRIVGDGRRPSQPRRLPALVVIPTVRPSSLAAALRTGSVRAITWTSPSEPGAGPGDTSSIRSFDRSAVRL